MFNMILTVLATALGVMAISDLVRGRSFISFRKHLSAKEIRWAAGAQLCAAFFVLSATLFDDTDKNLLTTVSPMLFVVAIRCLMASSKAGRKTL